MSCLDLMLNQASSRGDSTLDSDQKGFLVITLRKAVTVPCWRPWCDPFLPKCQLQFLRLIWKLVLGKNRQVSSFPCATEEQENTASMSPGQQESLLVYNSPEFYEGEAPDKEVGWGNSYAQKAVLSGRVTSTEGFCPTLLHKLCRCIKRYSLGNVQEM